MLQLSKDTDLSGYERMTPQVPIQSQLEEPLLPSRNSIQVCSLPYIPGTFPSTNSIIDFQIAGKMPQYRAPLPPSNGQSVGTTVTSVVSSSSSSSSTSSLPAAITASISTNVLNPGDQYLGTILLAKSFQLIFLSVTVPARVQLYSTAATQAGDLFRPVTMAPGLGTNQGIISDAYIDTAPVVFQYSDTVGSNGDSPQSNRIYVTITNVGASSTAITASITYVPSQS